LDLLSEQKKLVIIQGPTASGKSDLAVMLAESFSGEIVNADSMQIYRGMDIGTAKPCSDTMGRVPHHLFGIINPDESFSAADFRREAERTIRDIHGRGKNVFVVGGTGLYIKVLTGGLVDSPGGNEEFREEMKRIARDFGNMKLYDRLVRADPDTAENLHPNDLLRIIRALEVYEMTGYPVSELRKRHRFSDAGGFSCLKLGITAHRSELYCKIDTRVDLMFEHGLVEEVRGLLAKGYSPRLKSMQSLGYRHVCAFIAGEYSLEEAVRLVKRDTRRYAKRQMTWFRKDGEIIWFEYPVNIDIISSDVIEFYAKGEGYGKSTV
jgi:tRNA dimethylallyltransferase